MISILLGTRPEIIKMAPVIRECEKGGADYFVVHTGQHYSYELDRVFFEELELPGPRYHLDAGSGSHAEQTARIMTGVERVLSREKPDHVLVQGDTNTVLAGALAAAKLNVPVGHVEAGLRSHDRTMPEEVNRVVADHLSDLLFAPTETARANLVREGIDPRRIFVTGNTIVDAVLQNLAISAKTDVLRQQSLDRRRYFLVTAHRQENVDNKGRLREILKSLRLLHEAYELPVIFPVHPRTAKRIGEFGLSTDGVVVRPPYSFLEFLQMEANARLVLTDSGGVQEETCILGVPCVTLRDNTERPETVEAGSNVLAGAASGTILSSAGKMLDRGHGWKNPFGSGDSAGQIVRILTYGE